MQGAEGRELMRGVRETEIRVRIGERGVKGKVGVIREMERGGGGVTSKVYVKGWSKERGVKVSGIGKGIEKRYGG